jgi:hypothetical protein
MLNYLLSRGMNALKVHTATDTPDAERHDTHGHTIGDTQPPTTGFDARDRLLGRLDDTTVQQAAAPLAHE